MNPKDALGSQKPNISHLPLGPLLECCAAIAEGRIKYGPWNWREEKVSETIYVDAAIRHLMQWLSGEDIDPDSGVNHITKAITGLLILRDAQLNDASIDTREVKQELNVKGICEQLAGVAKKYEGVETPYSKKLAAEKEEPTKSDCYQYELYDLVEVWYDNSATPFIAVVLQGTPQVDGDHLVPVQFPSGSVRVVKASRLTKVDYEKAGDVTIKSFPVSSINTLESLVGVILSDGRVVVNYNPVERTHDIIAGGVVTSIRLTDAWFVYPGHRIEVVEWS